MRVIPHAKQRYDTVGDWRFTRNGDLEITVSKLSDPRYETAIGIHELYEAIACKQAGISEKDVTAFDVAYELRRKPDDISEPGDDPKAPCHYQHVAATKLERLYIELQGLDWEAYNTEVEKVHK